MGRRILAYLVNQFYRPKPWQKMSKPSHFHGYAALRASWAAGVRPHARFLTGPPARPVDSSICLIIPLIILLTLRILLIPTLQLLLLTIRLQVDMRTTRGRAVDC